MLATLSFLALPALSYAATVTIAATDPSIQFTPGWSQGFSEATGGNYSFTNEFLCHLTAALPASATSVSYVAFKRPGGSTYGYSLDCEENCILQTVNATDSSVTDDATAAQSTIFTVALDPTTQHTLRVYNLGTGSSPSSNDSSQITFDHLSVLVQDDDAAPPTTGISSSITTASAVPVQSSSLPTPNTGSSTLASNFVPSSSSAQGASSVSSSPVASMPVLPITPTTDIPSAANASSSSDASTAASSGVSKKLVIGLTVLALVVAVSGTVFLLVFLRQRRERRAKETQAAHASIIPIMPPPPPEMRTASLNPFSDPSPFVDPPGNPFADPSAPPLSLDIPPRASPSMHRRMDSRSTSPGSAPTIPLPDLPPHARIDRMQSRADSPASSIPRTDLWISRTPMKTEFFAV